MKVGHLTAKQQQKSHDASEERNEVRGEKE